MGRLIGINGYARSGKDTVANFLVQDHGFVRIAFADLLKQALYKLNPIVDPIVGFRVNDLVDDYGREKAKELPEVRQLLQRLGTEVGRDMLGADIWVDAAFAQMSSDTDYCISDMRFWNEATRIVNNGGITVRINRRGVGPANNHPGEVALDSWHFDYILENDRDLDYLRVLTDKIVK